MNNSFTQDLFPETLLVSIKNGQAKTNTIKIAERFHKRHKNILRDIENLIKARAEAGLDRLKFEPIYYTDSMNRQQMTYEMDRKACHIFLMGLGGKHASIWREDFYNAFETMEAYIGAEKTRHAAAFGQLKPKLLMIEAGDKQGLSRAAIAAQTGHKCLGSITAGRARARALGLQVKPAKKGGAA